ncbi:MAG: hypothetical protein H0X30_36385 [Anaerolineae bacterium]|nr:hypothetical protein [Anaerolineae bacterium]
MTSVVQAKFDPYVEDLAHDWGDVPHPEPVWSSAAMVGHLGRLDPAGDVDAFALTFDKPVEKWTFSASVPVCANHFASVNLQMALIGPGLPSPTMKLPFDLPQGMGAVVHSSSDKGKDSILYRNTDVMGIPTYVYPTFWVNIPQAGQYVMAVWAENEAVAPYILLTGTGSDQFSNRTPEEQEKAFTQVYNGYWMHQDCTPVPLTPEPVTLFGQLKSTAPMMTARAVQSATLLNNGKVLIAGGIAAEGVFLKSAELYDPATSSFSAIGDMATARAGHTATLLKDGKVLLVGGDYQDKMLSAEVYDPVANTFTAVGSLHTARDAFSATLLADSRVLITGIGLKGGASAEIYDPATATFTVTGEMKTPRSMHTATLLDDGKVLIVGGLDKQRQVLANAEIYDPTAGTFTPTANWMTIKRHKQAAVRLNDGRVLIMGGADERDWEGQRRSAEIYDPATGLFKPIGNMVDPHFKFDTAVALMPDGDVVIAGSKRVEIYRVTDGTFAVANGDMDSDRYFSTATTLPDGHVLITGGYDANIQTTAQAWIYQ